MAGGDRPNDEDRRRKRRNWALLAVLVAFVVLVYFVSTRTHGDEHAMRPVRNNARVGLLLCSLVVAMVAMSFAAVPLYRLFCQVTGYGVNHAGG